MTYVDRSPPPPNALGTSPAPGNTGQGKQAWLKALEEAGWRDALRAARPWGRESPASSTEGQEYGSLPVRQLFADHSPAGDLPSWNCEVGASHNASPEILSLDSVGAEVESHRTAAGEFSPAAVISQAVVLGERSGRAGPAALGHSAPTPQTKWQASNLSVLRTGEGLEVWVRDASLTPSALTTLLTGLRNSLAEQGTSLVRVSLNGKLLYSPADPGSPDEHHSRGE